MPSICRHFCGRRCDSRCLILVFRIGTVLIPVCGEPGGRLFWNNGFTHQIAPLGFGCRPAPRFRNGAEAVAVKVVVRFRAISFSDYAASRPVTVAVKVVVRFRAISFSDYAASRPAMGSPSPACGARSVAPMAFVDVSGLSHTAFGRGQDRMRPDHLSGLASRACL